MILNSRNNSYDFRFPRKFIPEEVTQKYKKYLNKVPGGLLAEPIDFVNYSIQGENYRDFFFTKYKKVIIFI